MRVARRGACGAARALLRRAVGRRWRRRRLRRVRATVAAARCCALTPRAVAPWHRAPDARARRPLRRRVACAAGALLVAALAGAPQCAALQPNNNCTADSTNTFTVSVNFFVSQMGEFQARSAGLLTCSTRVACSRLTHSLLWRRWRTAKAPAPCCS
jgi:hypothetical protein